MTITINGLVLDRAEGEIACGYSAAGSMPPVVRLMFPVASVVYLSRRDMDDLIAGLTYLAADVCSEQPTHGERR